MDTTTLSVIATVIAALTFLALIVALYFVLGHSQARRAVYREVGLLRRLWSAIDPTVANDSANWAENTTHTLRLLMITAIIFAVVIAAWAAAASVMRTIWLYRPESGSGVHDSLSVSDWKTWILALFQIVRGIGGTLVLCAAGGVVGAVVGFVFGLPRPPPDGATPGQNGQSDKGGDDSKAGDSSSGWRLNNNLIQIGDSLTKGFIAISLVEAKSGFRLFENEAQVAAVWLFASRHGSPAVLPAAIAGAAVFGFLFAYLYTQLIISGLFAEAASQLESLPGRGARATLAGIRSIREALVPRISRSRDATEPIDQPTPDEVEAALEYVDIGYRDLISRPQLTREQVLSWTLAKAVLNDYEEAAKGFLYLLRVYHNG